MNELLPAPGDQAAAPETLNIPMARQFARTAQRVPFVSFVECRKADGRYEVVVLELEVERPQHPEHDIRRYEVVAFVFFVDQSLAPEVLALRADFPHVPHLNLRFEEFPRSLCIYEDAFAEFGFKWNPSHFIEDTRSWLARTSRGEAHAADQRLEPLLDANAAELVLPHNLLEGVTSPTVLFLRPSQWSNRRIVVEGTLEGPQPGSICAVHVVGSPQVHGIIRKQPRQVAELHELLASASIDLKTSLHTALRSFVSSNSSDLMKHTTIILLIDLPKLRRAGGEVESTDYVAFGIPTSIGDLGVALGLHEKAGGHYVPIIGASGNAQISTLPVVAFRRLVTLSPELASAFNGVQPNSDRMSFVGLGALGSQVFNNLVRSGFGIWSLIDKDFQFPHNNARHFLFEMAGESKAEAMAAIARAVLPSRPAAALVADVIFPKDLMDEVSAVFRGSRLVVDCAASVAVSRKLARDFEGGRRVSVFLNPAGTDLVVIAEPCDRSVRLDQLEFTYYRAIRNFPALIGHLKRTGPPLRFSNACRDLSAVIPQANVAIHAGIAAHVLRSISSQDSGQITVWHLGENLEISRVDVPVSKPVESRSGMWTVFTDETVLDAIRKARARKLPKETGGVLLGSFDIERRLVFVSDMISSPADSKEWPTLYVRGCVGLKNRLDAAIHDTQGGLEYVGEWHSHPPRYRSQMSSQDRRALETLASEMQKDGRPGVMLIVGTDETIYLSAAD